MTWLIVLLMLAVPLIALAGVLLGAWIVHRSRLGLSPMIPMPTIPTIFPTKEPEKQDEKPQPPRSRL